MVQTGWDVSVIALGTWVFGGTNWGETPQRELVDAVHAAQDQGINLIDTAPVYGNGKAEKIIGIALKKRRDAFYIATKCGLVGKGKQTRHDLSRASIFREIDGSLERLRTDHVDLYQCHWPDPDTPIEETMTALRDLQKAGKIRAIGVSNFDADLLKRSCARTAVATYQGQYSLLARALENEILPFVQKNEMGFLAYGALGGGILTGKYRQIPRFAANDARSFFYPFYQSEDQKSQKRLERLAGLKDRLQPLNQVALNWVRQKPGVLSVIAGCRNRQQVRQNAGAADWDLTPDQTQKLEVLDL